MREPWATTWASLQPPGFTISLSVTDQAFTDRLAAAKITTLAALSSGSWIRRTFGRECKQHTGSAHAAMEVRPHDLEDKRFLLLIAAVSLVFSRVLLPVVQRSETGNSVF
jgi:hypothetical protein